VNLETVARTTSGFSGKVLCDITLHNDVFCGLLGADLANLVNQAALRGSADGKDAVTMKDFDWARDKIIMGKSTSFLSWVTRKYPQGLPVGGQDQQCDIIW